MHARNNRKAVFSVVRAAAACGQGPGKLFPAATDTTATIEERRFLCSPCREIESEAELEEVPKEEAAVERFEALKELYRDRHLIVRCRGQQKKRAQGYGGSRKKLAAACR
jgi:hypothetical protein